MNRKHALQSSVTELKAVQTEKLLWYLGFKCRGNITVLICGFFFTAIDGSEKGKFLLTHIWRIWCVAQPMSFYNCLHIALSLGSIRNISSWETQQQRSTKHIFFQPWAQSYDSTATIFSFRKLPATFPWLVHWLVKRVLHIHQTILELFQ